jgi:inosine/xanthosine triphosphate pyrophosphatase family protein
LREILSPLPVEIVSLRDLGIEIDVVEDGRTPEENARKKARSYWTASSLPTLAVDGGLYIARFTAEKQPGVFVKRIHRMGRTITDREIFAHYVRELDRVGGHSMATWQIAIVLMLSADRVFARTFSLEVLLTTREQGPLRPGEPLTSLMVDPDTGKHYTEMTYGERPDSRHVLAFLSECVDQIGERKEADGSGLPAACHQTVSDSS